MILDQWATRWGISEQAIADLKREYRADRSIEAATSGASEAAVQNVLRLEATRKGCRLWRNNVGATYTPEGSFIRYGIANDSPAVNKQIKSADLIGIRPVKITHAHVGSTIGQFLSREVKAGGWRFSPNNEREQAQLRWAELIVSLGGDACFAVGEGTI